MTAAVMRYTVIVRHPDTDAPTALVEGQPVPDWAEDLVHDDDLLTEDKPAKDTSTSQGSGDQGSSQAGQQPNPEPNGDKPVDWSKKTVEELKAEVARRNEGRDDDDHVEVEAPGNKPELVAALQGDDAAQAEKNQD